MATVICYILYFLGAVATMVAIVEIKPSRAGLLFIAVLWPFLIVVALVLELLGVEYKDKK